MWFSSMDNRYKLYRFVWSEGTGHLLTIETFYMFLNNLHKWDPLAYEIKLRNWE